MPKSAFVTLGAAVSFSLLSGALVPAHADKVSDAITKANEAYKAGNLGTATTELNYALTKISGLLSKAYRSTFPKAPEGWRAGRVRSSTGNALIQVRGQMLSTRYTKQGGRGRINAQLIVDNPAAQVYLNLFANPAYARAAGYDPVKIDGITEVAMVKFNDERNSGDLILLIKGRVLVKLTGRQIQSADVLTAMIKRWNMAKVKTIAGIK